MNHRVGATVYLICACCGKKFWAMPSETVFVWCHRATGMPVEKGTFGAELRPVGPCCDTEVVDALHADPDDLEQLAWADGLDTMH